MKMLITNIALFAFAVQLKPAPLLHFPIDRLVSFGFTDLLDTLFPIPLLKKLTFASLGYITYCFYSFFSSGAIGKKNRKVKILRRDWGKTSELKGGIS